MALNKYATFYIGDALFGIDILLVREINRNIEITPVDLAHESIRGIINLRGQLVTMFDLGILIGLGATTVSDETCSVVLKSRGDIADTTDFKAVKEALGDDICGFVVDKIGDIISADSTQYEAPPASVSGIRRDSIDHVIRLDEDLLVILDISTLFSLSKQAA